MATTTSSGKRFRKSKATDASGPGGPWSGHAPRRLREGYQGSTSDAGWKLWRKHLAKRKLRPISKLFKGRGSPLFWALPAGADLEQAEQIIDLLRHPRLSERRTAGLDNAVLCWLSRADVAAPEVGFALECLAWCAALPELAEHVEEQVWWRLLNRLIATSTAEARGDDPLATQMLHGELPATLAYLFAELAVWGALVETSRATLDEASESLLDDKAMVDGGQLDELRPLLACWTRWRCVCGEMDASIWHDAMPRRFARLVEHALRLSRSDGTQLFSAPDAPVWNRRMLKTALELADSARTERVYRLIASGGESSDNPRRRAAAPAVNLEDAGLAVLRPSWHRSSSQLAVNYSGPQLQIELSVGRHLLCRGAVAIQLSVDARPLVPRRGWEQVCWESDRDVDYLELELRYSEDIAVQRHFVLARQAGFLLLADAVLGNIPRKIAYRSTLPLAADVAFHAEDETREGALKIGPRTRGRVFPLALAEWRAGPSWGSLEADGGSLVLEQETPGRSLLAPLFIDLDPRRARKEATWRQLTVGELREVVPPDVAVGYRVQVGKQQWLVYRSLGEVGMRTVLGQNLRHEFLVGRFGSKGKVKKLLEIEV